MAKKRKRTITYRSEFASKPPSQQEHSLALLRRLLRALFGGDAAPGEDARPKSLRSSRVSGVDRPE